jgi:hypothetical protein
MELIVRESRHRRFSLRTCFSVTHFLIREGSVRFYKFVFLMAFVGLPLQSQQKIQLRRVIEKPPEMSRPAAEPSQPAATKGTSGQAKPASPPPTVNKTTGGAAVAPNTPRPSAPPSAASTDAALEKDIQARFARSKIAENNFRVSVSGEIATLRGKTDTTQHKSTATRLAKSAGARAVVNKIEVSAAGRQKAARNLERARRAQRGDKRSEPRDGR